MLTLMNNDNNENRQPKPASTTPPQPALADSPQQPSANQTSPNSPGLSTNQPTPDQTKTVPIATNAPAEAEAPQQPAASTLNQDQNPVSTPQQPTPSPEKTPEAIKKSRLSLKTILIVISLLLVIAAVAVGGYLVGRGDKEVVFKEREPKTLDLPPQAVVMTECVPGRGKQYILPQDIPKGPIYDVHDGKVVAIEYRIVIKDVESDPDKLSNTILGLTRDYPVDHFSMVPEIASSDKPVESFHLAMFVVPKEEANKISCSS